jgi:carboxymethylenebutenolidase
MPFTIHRKLAENGFVALSILYFSRTPSPPEAFPANTFMDVPFQALVEARPIWIETIEDGLSYMHSRPEVDPDRIGLVGYSLGASLALGIDQNQNNHAALISISGFVWNDEELENLVAGDSPTLILQAGDDEWVPMNDALDIKDALETNGIEHELVVIEGADHRWIDQPGKDGFDAILEFLESHLGSSGP